MNSIVINKWNVEWTGWKGTKGKTVGWMDKRECAICSKPMLDGEEVYRAQGEWTRHWACKYPDNRPDRLVGQWLARKNSTYLYVNVGGPDECMGEYKRGESFEIGEEPLVTELTPEPEREKFVTDGLVRMRALIERMS